MFDIKNVDPYGVLNLQLRTTPLTSEEQRALDEALTVEPQLKIGNKMPPRPKPMTRARAIVRAVQLYRKRFRKEPPHYGSDLWNMVFEEYFGRPPVNIHDPRWDDLLFTNKREGVPIGGLSCAEKLRKRGVI